MECAGNRSVVKHLCDEVCITVCTHYLIYEINWVDSLFSVRHSEHELEHNSLFSARKPPGF